MPTTLPTEKFTWYLHGKHVKQRQWVLPDGSTVAVTLEPSRPTSNEFAVSVTPTYTAKTVTPPPPPSSSTAPTLPAGFANVSALVFDNADPTSAGWDSGQGGVPVHGYMNNVQCLKQNAFKNAAGNLVVRLSSTSQGATITTAPINDPRNARRGTGAATGVVFTDNMVAQARIRYPVANGAIPLWAGFWTEPMDNIWPKDGEFDISEAARWQGGNGVMTVNIHEQNAAPDWVVKTNVMDGGFHDYAIVRKAGAQGSVVSVFVDGQPVEENYQTTFNAPHFLLLTAGLGPGQPAPAFPCDVEVEHVRAWQLA